MTLFQISLKQLLITLLLFIAYGCSKDNVEEIVDCSKSNLALTMVSSMDTSSCTASDGTILVMATGGKGPYTFALNSVTNSTGDFQELPAGNYELMVTDAGGCVATLAAQVKATGSTLDIQLVAGADTDCLSDNGSITATGVGGVEPYQYRLNGGTFTSAATFSNLSQGTYSVEVKDDSGCSHIQSIKVLRGNTGVSFSSQIKPIINTKCAISGCHNGDNGANRNWTIFSNVASNASEIKKRTGNRSMPLTGSLTQQQIDLIACWVDDGAKNN